MSAPYSYIRPYPTRIDASGDVTIAAGATLQFLGSAARQTRRYAIITNLDTAINVTVEKLNGLSLLTVFPQSIDTIETPDAFQLHNKGGSTITVQVAEFYYDDSVSSIKQAENLASGGGGGFAGGDFGGQSQGGGHTQPK